MTEFERHHLQDVCDQLIRNQKTLLLASRSEQGDADISYAPYVCEEFTFYIFVSELAKHTKNLLTHPQASILFIQSEAEANNLFARQRLTLECRVTEIGHNDPIYSKQLAAMELTFRETVSLLRSLSDFHLLALSPERGQFVAGFGQSFAVDANGCLQ